MLEQEISKEQIAQLYLFCEKHYVRFYDVQVELVDHLANAIEEKMTTNPQLSFDDALNSVYAGFGVMGFSKVIFSKSQLVHRKWRKMRWQYFCSFFTWPRAIFSLLLIALVFFIHSFLSISSQKIVLLSLSVLFLIKEIIIAKQFFNRNKQVKGKLLMTVNGYFFPVMSPMYFNMVINFYIGGERSFYKTWFGPEEFFSQAFFFLSAFTLITLYFLSLAYQYTTEKILTEAERQYPEAFAQ